MKRNDGWVAETHQTVAIFSPLFNKPFLFAILYSGNSLVQLDLLIVFVEAHIKEPFRYEIHLVRTIPEYC